MRRLKRRSIDTLGPRLARRALLRWFNHPLGRSLQAAEAGRLRLALSGLYGTVAVQLGRLGRGDLLEGSNAPTRILVDVLPAAQHSPVRAQVDALPLASGSADLVLLPHTLDFASHPHQVLREAQRVLRPEGHVLILGFNPFSLWGLWRLILRRRHPIPWSAHFVSLARVKDWLSLLELEPTQISMVYYRPPLRNERVQDRMFFMDYVGGRWLPGMAAAYLVVAKKRVVGMTPLRPAWQRKKKLVAGLTQPAARVIYPRIPQWRLHRDG